MAKRVCTGCRAIYDPRTTGARAGRCPTCSRSHNRARGSREERGYGVVRDFVGHGVGTKLHEDPSVPNFGHAGRGIRLLPGMTLAIEPMINLGTYKVKQLSDGWTVKTADGKLAAHFEHTIAITSNGPVILTKV